MLVLKLLFWLSLGALLWTHAVYPLGAPALARVRTRRVRKEAIEPHVTVIVAAYNEEPVIERRLENLLALDYPADRLDVVVTSDASTDRTHELVERFGDRVGLIINPRGGKVAAQNRAVRETGGEILAFSDANATWAPDALRQLVANFADPDVAYVCGRLVLEAADGSNQEGVYWRYELAQREAESRLGSVTGGNGSIYAVRRSDYVEIANDLISDLVEPLALVRLGRRVVYEPEAVSVEEASTSHTVEFRRKVRILTRSIKGLLHMRALLNPFRYGIFSFQLFAHKLLRYIVPVFLLSGLGSLIGLAAMRQYRGSFLIVTLTLAAATSVARRMERRGSNPLVRACHLLYYYLLVNYALVPAWINIVRGTRMTLWVPERKEA